MDETVWDESAFYQEEEEGEGKKGAEEGEGEEGRRERGAGAANQLKPAYDMWNARHVMEGPLWASARALLVQDDALRMRTAATKWALQLQFFLLKDVKPLHFREAKFKM